MKAASADVIPLRRSGPRPGDQDTGYRWRERDEVMQGLCNRITDSGWSAEEISARCHGQVAASTITNWMNGTTFQPQNYKLDWVAYALDIKRIGQGWRKRRLPPLARGVEAKKREGK